MIRPSLNIYENEKQLYYEQFQRYKDSDIFMLAKYTFVYEGKNIISRNIVFEKLDYDPSEGKTGTGKTTSDLIGGTKPAF